MSWSDEQNGGLEVLRIIQLDAAILDHEILQLFGSQLKTVFKYLPREIFKWQPEINLLLRAVIWKFTIYNKSATIGQSLFDVRYALNTKDGYKQIALKEKAVLGLVYAVQNWMNERIYDFISYFGQHSYTIDKVRTVLRWIEKLWRLASFVNFLIFLQQGIYPTLLERFLRLRHIYNKPQSFKKGSFKFLNREILWHGYAELLFFILPLINISRLRNFLRRFTGLSSDVLTAEYSKVDSRLSKTCPICNDIPTQPYVGKCGHLYCYYCITSSCLSDPGFICPLCNIAVGQDILPYQP